MSIATARDRTRYTTWIVAGFALALAIAAGAYVFARRDGAAQTRTDVAGAQDASTASTGDPASAPPHDAQAAAQESDATANTTDTSSAAALASAPSAVPAPPSASVNQVASASPPQAAPASVAATADDDGDAPSAHKAPRLSADQQSLADMVGDTRRSSAAQSNTTD